jgi:hypothetical protein
MIHACGTSNWHLPIACDRCNIKSDSRRHPQATRRQRGRAVTQGLPIRDRWPASVTASRRLTKGDRHSNCAHWRPPALCKGARPRPRLVAGDLDQLDCRQSCAANSPEIPLDRCCHTGPAKHHPSSGTTEKGK